MNNMQEVLDLVCYFQTGAQGVERYKINPFVEGDNVAEHIARVLRLLAYIIPSLKKEFPDQPGLIEEIFACLVIHDDDEVIAGVDIPTAIKVHNTNDNEELRSFSETISTLPKETREFLVEKFSSFRNKSSLAAKIAKALDNISGNQLVIEQIGGLVNPDSARFCVEYAQKIMGVSKTVDKLAQAQINQVVDLRNKMRDLLQVDVMTHILDKSKVYTSIKEL